VAFANYTLDDFGVSFSTSAIHKKGGLEIVSPQNVEDSGSSDRIRPIVEGQGDPAAEVHGFTRRGKAR